MTGVQTCALPIHVADAASAEGIEAEGAAGIRRGDVWERERGSNIVERLGSPMMRPRIVGGRHLTAHPSRKDFSWISTKPPTNRCTMASRMPGRCRNAFAVGLFLIARGDVGQWALNRRCTPGACRRNSIFWILSKSRGRKSVE